MAQSRTDPEEIVTEYLRIWEEGDFADLPNLVTESFTFTSPSAGSIEGRENVLEYAEAIENGISDFQMAVHEMVVDGDVVVVEGTLSGVHDGEFGDLPPTGERFEIPRMAKFVVADDKLEQERVYFDRYGFLSQLGLVDE